ncbi:MAG: heat-shock protein Hsp20 [Candidatus Nealsonbacteria bacterium CG23_combo_of_CG06-09_8_20_14_all_40_13]|uniref:Heat-shock protein Hsp20 n=1 Tax=Candidatus Nealsonbacteria bacterium CG23_combo_of_CG06-09_8_20_14_all_40_13 TaxID=1974724 RepID=A0A2G9YRC9_9BACT|nr:MAG: heat-shock protein Hsp20 [Candidatus Nealsonbacteria bacterium CG23_combo_of_CG06-09_8_20_14_all_40_13]PIR70791.1 MAG: heat-shock protein Hsp20 [Candidatus Nealsonbacteria bacterium CG10_big_fil_rev_8_21_14_0_10_40_24]PIU43556.1 MAG: heat-shock protein Hsp20 [Candidatus Nealsonbacteria bacterium CG07_land_8_20_14_0_80_40_10]
MSNNKETKDLSTDADWMDDYEGQLAVDVYQTEEDVVIKAPIAGVKREDLEISITDEVVNIKGERRENEEVAKENYFVQECYWGGFSRSYILPIAVDSEQAKASLKKGILTIAIPKLEKSKTRILKVEDVEE